LLLCGNQLNINQFMAILAIAFDAGERRIKILESVLKYKTLLDSYTVKSI